jgi:predicted permease
MEGIAGQLASAHPENKDVRALVEPYVRRVIGTEVVSTLFTMLAAVFGVMIIACVNVTNLQLARAADRTKDVAIRVAIGAGRWRIVRQTLVEGLVLSGVGSLLGLAVAWTGATMFSRAIVDTDPPFWIDVRLDPVVLAFVTVVTVTAALVSSLVPGWRLARTDVNGSLKDEGRGTTSLRMGRFTRWLVVVEVAVSCVLLVVSGLMIRSIVATSRIHFPFATEDVFYGSVSLEQRSFPDPDAVTRATAQVEEQLSRVPGIRAVALATDVPRATSGGTRVAVEGRTYDSADDYPQAASVTASVGYFDVLRVKPVLGRLFDQGDAATGLAVAVVDQGFAQRHLPEGPIGRRIRFGRNSEEGMKFDDSPWLTVVGVVPTLADSGQSTMITDAVYRPMAQGASRSFLVLAATQGDPMSVSSGVRETLAQIGEGTPLTNANSLAEELWRQGWAVRVFGSLFMTFGVAALVLASAGLYGVMAFGVKQRTQEIGVRMAMGADRRSVLRMVLWQGMWRVALAIAVGLVPGWLVGTQMSALIRGVSPADPLVYSLTAATLLLSGALATLAPALRAASVDPIVALRGEG